MADNDIKIPIKVIGSAGAPVLFNGAGTYKIQMQQGTSTANTTRLRSGSWMSAVKVG